MAKIVYEVKVESRDNDEGKIAKDTLLVEDNSLTGAEVRVNEYLAEENYSEFEIIQITKKKFTDVLMMESDD